MGLLVGLPLKLFHILFVVLRFGWPLILAAVVIFVVRRRRAASGSPRDKGPDGPVVEVDYTVVDEEEQP